MNTSRGFSLLIVVLVVAGLGLLLLGNHGFKPILQEAVTALPSEQTIFTFEAELTPSTEMMFRSPQPTSSANPPPAEIVSRSTGVVLKTLPEARGFGGDIYSGSSRPTVSPKGNYLAYLSGNAVMIADTKEHRVAITDPSYAQYPEINTRLHTWSPDERKLLFTLSVTTGCGMTADPCPEVEVPEGLPEGFLLADLDAGTVQHLASLSTKTHYYFEGWLDNDTLVFERDNVVYEYTLGDLAITPSSRFGTPFAKINFFSFIGTAVDGTYLYVRGQGQNSGTPLELVARKDGRDQVIVSYPWAKVQSRDISISDDGRFVSWTYQDTGVTRTYDLLEQKEVSEGLGT